MSEKTFSADDKALPEVIAFVENELEKACCPMKTAMSLTVAIEEMFVNVAHYAYPNGSGTATLAIKHNADKNEIMFRMTDSGVPFNPLEKPDPDVTLSAKERKIGGLGIFMMKKTMDEVFYANTNGENILTMIKKL